MIEIVNHNRHGRGRVRVLALKVMVLLLPKEGGERVEMLAALSVPVLLLLRARADAAGHVVLAAFIVVAENVVCGSDVHHAVLGVRVARLVRVVLHRQLLVRLADLLGGRAALDAQHLRGFFSRENDI